MADKEERILITTRHKNEKLNMTFTDMYKEYTIQEAIERMAKAMADVSNIIYISEEQWKVVKNGFKISAEAALNALLENKK